MTDQAGVLAQLARVFARVRGTDSLPMGLCHACADMLEVRGGAITLAYTTPERVTLCATDHTATRLEDLQDVLGQGPGLDAYLTGRPVTAYLGGKTAQRWPMFSNAALQEVGAVVMYALPIRPHTSVLGVLTLYHLEPAPPPRDLGVAQFLADAVGTALLHDPASQIELSEGPWAARMEIHQATGMVIGQLRINAGDALALLRAHAFAEGASLITIARDVLGRRIDFARLVQPAQDDGGGPT